MNMAAVQALVSTTLIGAAWSGLPGNFAAGAFMPKPVQITRVAQA